MRAIGIKQLKDRLSEYVRLAEAGETVLVTDRDRVVAEMGPARPDRPRAVADAVVEDWVRRGVLQPASLPRGTRPNGLRLVPHEELMAELDRDRDDR